MIIKLYKQSPGKREFAVLELLGACFWSPSVELDGVKLAQVAPSSPAKLA